MRVSKTYDFKEISGFELGWSFFGSPMMTVFCYAFGDVMVDTGLSHMQKEVVQIARDRKVKTIYLTHKHEDHSGNAAALKQELGINVFGHPLTKKKMLDIARILPYQKMMWGKTSSLDLEILPEKIDTSLGEMIPVHTPGHSKDHIAFFLENEGVLFSGDLYLGDKIKFFRVNEDIGVTIESLKNVLKLDFDTLLCSHHPKLENGKKRIESKLGFLEDLYGSIILQWKKGLSERAVLKALPLKEAYFIKYFCFGDVSMINGVRSAVRHYKQNNM